MMFYFVLNRLYHTLLSIGLMFVLFLTKDARLLWKKMLASCARGCRVTAPADSPAKERGTVNTVVESKSKDNLKQ